MYDELLKVQDGTPVATAVATALLLLLLLDSVAQLISAIQQRTRMLRYAENDSCPVAADAITGSGKGVQFLVAEWGN